jgi:dCMP deaminase
MNHSDALSIAYLRLAYQTAFEQSTDPSTQNGAVLESAIPVTLGAPSKTLNYIQTELLAYESVTSANFFPKNVKESKERWERPLKYSYVEHAERNVIYKAAREGFKTEGATMYCAWASCADCARAIIQAGIKKLVTHHDPYADTRFGQPVSSVWKDSIKLALGMLEEAGVEISWIGDKLFPNDEVKIRFNGILVSP